MPTELSPIILILDVDETRVRITPEGQNEDQTYVGYASAYQPFNNKSTPERLSLA